MAQRDFPAATSVVAYECCKTEVAVEEGGGSDYTVGKIFFLVLGICVASF